MLKQYEEISVLEQGDDGAIISIRGQEGPAVLLGPVYLGHLQQVALKAADGSESAVRLLILEVGTLLATYNETCNKFYGSEPGPKLLSRALEELADLRRQLEGNAPSGGGPRTPTTAS